MVRSASLTVSATAGVCRRDASQGEAGISCPAGGDEGMHGTRRRSTRVGSRPRPSRPADGFLQ